MSYLLNGVKIICNYFCENPKVLKKAAVTGLGVAKKRRFAALFLA
jgi:hypothetical protein